MKVYVTVVRSDEDFQEMLDGFLIAAKESFEKDGRHDHGVCWITEKGEVQVHAFDKYASIGSKLGLGEGQAKQMAWSFIGADMALGRAVGFIEVGEAWAAHFDRNSKSAEEQAADVYDKWSSIKDMPGRVEQLFVRARWREKPYWISWDIGRRGKEVYLHNYKEFNERTGQGTRSEALDIAVDRTLGIKK